MLDKKQQGMRMRSWSILAAAAAAGVFALSSGALAQAKKEKDKAPAAAPAAPAAPDAQAQSAWVKLCNKVAGVTKNKEGKEEKKEINVCVTVHERLDGMTGRPILSMVIQQADSTDKQVIQVTVPFGMQIQAGVRATIFPKDLWEMIQKNEKIDETKVKPFGLPYTHCLPIGCVAEIEMTPEILKDMKAGGGVIIHTMGVEPIGFAIPLNGFEKTYGGPPVDNEKYGEARRALYEQIAERQKQYREELKKQNDELQKMQGNEALKGTSPPAKAAPKKDAPKKEK